MRVAAAPLQLQFVNEADTKPLFLDSLRYQNTGGESLSFTRVDYLVSGFSLTTASGQRVLLEDEVAFVPHRGTRLRVASVPNQTYSALTFHIGLDPVTNHGDPSVHPPQSPLNPNRNRMHWDWQGGYIFMALEGHWRAKDQRLPNGYAYHFARNANRVAITLPVELELQSESRLTIAFDPTKLLSGLSFEDDGSTTHSADGDPVSEHIKRHLPGAFRVARVDSDQPPRLATRVKPIDLPKNPEPYPLRLPRGIPLPAFPLDNPIIKQRVNLGERLFRETKLSRNNSLSCASCHRGDALTDSRQFSPGVDGQHGNRHSMSLINLAWKSRFFWDGRAGSLREQALQPIQDHLEMDETLESVVAKLENDLTYPSLFKAAFGSGVISPQTISLAIENFLLTRLSFDSKFDRHLKGQAQLSPSEQRGFELFFTESEPRMGRRGADCFHCHGSAFFTDHAFHNNGLPVTDDIGLEKVSGRTSDRYKFITPSLRKIGQTAPYMHDGRFQTLEEVVRHYNQAPTRTETLDPNLAKHPNGLQLSVEDQAALVAFLKTL